VTPQRLRQIEALYHSAREREPGQRAAFLAGACQDDEDLRRDVESLLAADPTGTCFLDEPVMRQAAGILAPDPSSSEYGLAPGVELGPYVIETRLGAGGMGEVYRAKDKRLHRTVALKVLPQRLADTPGLRQRLEREAKLISSLNHPQICTLYDIGRQGEIDYLVMEFLEGGTLRRAMEAGPFPAAKATEIAIQVAGGLAAAHAAGLVHRDLKPDNIMFTRGGQVKILDFGLAKQGRTAADFSTGDLTDEGTVLGTAGYMSPEQAEGKPLDARTDIFSFGAVLYELLAGTRPFARNSRASTIAAIITEEPSPIRSAPPELDRIVQRCLRKDPARRFQTIADVKAALEDERQGVVPVVRTRRNRHWIGVSAIVLAASAAILAPIYIPWQQRPEPQVLPLTSYPGSEYDPAFSPDGNQIAFVWDGEDQTTPHIYLKLVGATDALRLTKGNRPERYPAWSRDGRWIAFNRRTDDGRANIIVTSALGGAERKIGELQACCSRLSWSPDIKWLVTGERLESNGGRLVLLNVETDEKRILVSPPAGAFGDYDPAFSPSGRMIAFVRYSLDTKSDVFVVPLSEDMKPSGPAFPVTDDGAGNGEPAWTPDGREIVYVSGLPGYLTDYGVWLHGSRLWRVSLSRHSKPRQIAFVHDAAQPSIAMNGQRMAYQLVSYDSNIWRIPIRSAAALPMKVAASTRDEYSPSYSPDGSKLAFCSMRTGVLEIWVSDADGSSPRQLTRFGRGITGSPQFSPDGELIAFDSSVTGSFEIYTIAADGGRPVQLTHRGIESAAPYWSRDGKQIYFESLRMGRREIWMMPVTGGEPVQVTRNGGYAACESPDGTELYYTKVYLGGALWKMHLPGGSETRAIDNVGTREFSCGKNVLYYARPAGGNTYEFMRVPYAGGAPEILGKAESVYLGFAVSPDERWLAYAKFDNSGSDLMLVEGFR
jgi:eukaryotic-like serine/threonine-protein kinase